MTAFPRPHSQPSNGRLAGLAALDARLIRHLRHWAEGASGTAKVTADLADCLGPARAARIVQLWAELLDIFDRFGHRPLDILAPDADGVSADEAGFARLVALAAEGNREDAMFAALMMVRADLSPIVTSLATQVGLSVRQSLLMDDTALCNATHRSVTQLH